MKRLLSYLFFVLLLIPVPGLAQQPKYAEISKEIWGSTNKEFQRVSIPEDMSATGSVILARYYDLKGQLNGKGRNKKLQLTNTFRERILINDTTTLKYFSAFAYAGYIRHFIRATGKQPSVVYAGIRIIKTSGMIKDVSINSAIPLPEDNNTGETTLNIPGLQPGDIVDFFFRQYQDLPAKRATSVFDFILAADKPILHYSVHAEMDKDCLLAYRALNAAPEFVTTRGQNALQILDLSLENISPLELSLWTAPYKQLPIVRLQFLSPEPDEESVFTGGLYPAADYPKVMEEIIQNIRSDFYDLQLGYGALVSTSQIKEMIADIKRDEKLPADSLPWYVYYALRYITYYQLRTNDGRSPGFMQLQTPDRKRFIVLLSLVLHRFHISHDIVLVPSRYGPEYKQAMSVDEFDYLIKTIDGKPLYMSGDGIYSHCNYVPPQYEGQQAPAISIKRFTDKFVRLADAGIIVNIPVTSHRQNVRIERLHVSLAEGFESLRINRQTQLKGHSRAAARELIDFEEASTQERRLWNIREYLPDTISTGERDSLQVNGMEREASKREYRKKLFAEEITSFFGQNPDELLRWDINEMGIRHHQPDLIYSTSFNMKGWTYKGDEGGYTIALGKLWGTSFNWADLPVERKTDIYLPYAASQEMLLSFTIPDGYAIENLGKLAVVINNECGSFTVESRLSDASLQIKLNLHFLRSVYKNNQWPQLHSILTAITRFRDFQLVLKKG